MPSVGGSLAYRDIRHRSDKFDAIRCLGHGMRGRMDIFGRIVRHQQSLFVIEIPSVAGRPVDGLLRARSIVGMNALNAPVERDERRPGVAMYSATFLAPD